MGNIAIDFSDQPSLLDYLPKTSASNEGHYNHYVETTDLFQGKMKHGWYLFLQDASARQHYQDYVHRGDWLSKATGTSHAMHALLSSGKGGTVQFAKHVAGDHYEEHKSQHSSSSASGGSTISTTKHHLIDIAFHDHDTQGVLHSIVFPIFLHSDDYKNWVAHRLEDTESTIELYKGERLTLEILPDQAMRMKDTLANGMSVVDPLEIRKLYFHEYWLYQFLAYVEELPIPISLATARFDRRGFPLIYVNKSFERMTLYERKDIIGKNCKFLHSHETESQKMSRVTEALRNAQAVKVMVSNIRKTGESFMNLLAMKPIFDVNGVYSYVVCAHYEVTDYQHIAYNISQVDDFLVSIPNIVTTHY
jgi:PAS domain S-box-containing protein